MYSNIYNPQASLDRINNQIAELERMKSQLPPVQQPITQNFQIAPTQNNTNELEAKYANNIDEVKNTLNQLTAGDVDAKILAIEIKDE